MKRLIHTARVLMALGCTLGWIALITGCNKEDCQDSECYNLPRVCIEIIPYDAEPPVCDQVTVTYSGNDWNDIDEECGTEDSEIWGQLNPTSCNYGSDSITISVAQDDQQESTQSIELAEHNYCGEDIAYVVVTLHEDGPPTFGETYYVSPCENGGQ